MKLKHQKTISSLVLLTSWIFKRFCILFNNYIFTKDLKKISCYLPAWISFMAAVTFPSFHEVG